VDPVEELAQRRPDNLHAEIVEINTKTRLTKQAPVAQRVPSRVGPAKTPPWLMTRWQAVR
jgi:hypothetical protein